MSLPNVFEVASLGSSLRGARLVRETLNSKTINLLGGVMAPAPITAALASGLVRVDLGWLIAMTVAALLLVARRRDAGRLAGTFLIMLYTVVAVQVTNAP